MTIHNTDTNVDELREHIRELQIALMKSKKRIEKLENAIDEALMFLEMLIAEATRVLSQPSGVPRVRWAFAKSQYICCIALRNILAKAKG